MINLNVCNILYFILFYISILLFLAPLQSLGLNGKNRTPTNGPIAPSASFTHPQQQPTIILPPAVSLQSLSPVTSNITISDPIQNIQQQTTSFDQEEKERLKNDLIQLKNELQKSKETIARLQKSEEQMRER